MPLDSTSGEYRQRVKAAQRAYNSMTTLGHPLETVKANRQLVFEYEDSVRTLWAGESDITRNIAMRRITGSRVLDEPEVDSIEQTYPFWTFDSIFSHILKLRANWPSQLHPDERSEAAPAVIVIDARPLQLTVKNGTKNHAIAILMALAQAVGDAHPIALLTDPLRPPLDQQFARFETLAWRAALLPRVFAYFRLSTMWVPDDATDLYLLRAPWIRRYSVFLDDIVGVYRTHFTKNATQFWHEQLGIEKLARSERLLALSNISAREAGSIFVGQSGAGRGKPEVVITSCTPALAPPESPAQGERHGMVVFGSDMPHKNVAIVAAAYAALSELDRSIDCAPTFANITSSDTQDYLRQLSTIFSQHKGHPVTFLDDVTDDELAGYVTHSRCAIIPSLHEGFSLPVVEALALGTPVVLSRIPAHQELLDEGPWFFDPTNVEELVQALVGVYRDGADWLGLQKQSLAAHYDPTQLASTVTQVVHELMNTEAADSATSPAPDRETPHPKLPRLLHLSGSGHSADAIPELRDREFMQKKFATASAKGNKWVQSVDHFDELGVVEHNRLVREFRSSRTWRAGRVVGSPFIFVKWLFTGSRAR